MRKIQVLFILVAILIFTPFTHEKKKETSCWETNVSKDNFFFCFLFTVLWMDVPQSCQDNHKKTTQRRGHLYQIWRKCMEMYCGFCNWRCKILPIRRVRQRTIIRVHSRTTYSRSFDIPMYFLQIQLYKPTHRLCGFLWSNITEDRQLTHA